MSFGNHTLNQRWIGSGSIDLSFSIVVAGDKECRLIAIRLQNVEEIGCIIIWTIIVSKSYNVVLHAVIDVIRVGDRSYQWSCNVKS